MSVRSYNLTRIFPSFKIPGVTIFCHTIQPDFYFLAEGYSEFCTFPFAEKTFALISVKSCPVSTKTGFISLGSLALSCHFFYSFKQKSLQGSSSGFAF